MLKKKKLKIILFLTIVVTGFLFFSTQQYAKTNSVVTTRKKIVVIKGNKKHIKIKNAEKKVKWKVTKGKNKIKIFRKNGKNKNKITFLAKKQGKAVIEAKVGKKKYKYIITIKSNKKNNTSQAQNSIIKNKEIASESNSKNEQENESKKENDATENLDVKYAIINFETYGLANVQDMVVEVGKPYGELPIPELAGHEFKGWLTEDGEKVTAESICTGDVILYADAEVLNGEVNEAIVSFETYGLANVQDMVVEVGKPYGELPIPELAGHEFKGWLTEDGEKVTAESICTGDVILYADVEVLNGEVDISHDYIGLYFLN